MEGKVQDIVLDGLLSHAAAGCLENRAHELKVWLWGFRGHVMLQASFMIEPFLEGFIAGARDIERARAEKHHGGLRVPKADLRPAKRLGQPAARALGASVLLGDRAPMEALERV
jgi:hypothetical protein